MSLGFASVPMPQAIAFALERHLLDLVDVGLLYALWSRADWHRRSAEITLSQLADACGWEQSASYLSKRLGRLKRDGWISFETPRGTRARYRITLAVEPSESRPSLNGASRPSLAAARSGIAAAIGADRSSELSESPEAARPRISPSHPSSSPSLGEAASPLPEPDLAEEPELVSPSPSESQIGPSVEERLEPLSEVETDLGEGTRGASFEIPVKAQQERARPFGFDISSAFLADLRPPEQREQVA